MCSHRRFPSYLSYCSYSEFYFKNSLAFLNFVKIREFQKFLTTLKIRVVNLSFRCSGGARETRDMKKSGASRKTDKDAKKTAKDEGQATTKKKREKAMVNWRETVESYLSRVRQRYRANCQKDGSGVSPEFLRLLATSIADDQVPAKVQPLSVCLYMSQSICEISHFT